MTSDTKEHGEPVSDAVRARGARGHDHDGRSAALIASMQAVVNAASVLAHVIESETATDIDQDDAQEKLCGAVDIYRRALKAKKPRAIPAEQAGTHV